MTLVSALILIFQNRIPEWPTQIGRNLVAMIVISAGIMWINERSAWLLRLIRRLYPILLFSMLYIQIGAINRIFFPEFLDPPIILLEQQIFGYQPAIHLSRMFPQLWVAEYFYFAYVSYYLLLPIPAIILFAQQRYAALEEYIFCLAVTMYTCFALFILLPIAGPPTALGTQLLPEGWFFIPLMQIINKNDIQGASIPSSHVAATAIMVFYTYKYLPRLAIVCAPIGLSLFIATMYCGLHYAVDVVAGLLMAALMLFVTQFLWKHVGREAML